MTEPELRAIRERVKTVRKGLDDLLIVALKDREALLAEVDSLRAELDQLRTQNIRVPESQPAPVNTSSVDDLITARLKHVVKLTGLSEATIRRYAAAGKFKLLKTSGATLVDMQSLRDFLRGSSRGKGS